MNPNYRIELADNIKGSEKMSFNNNSLSLDTIIKVIGVGNGGCNAVNRMIEEGLENVEFIAMNTDSQALSRSNASVRLVLGDRVTQGLGAGTDPERGAEAARENISEIEELVSGANLVFIASSFGGGTGTGASPIVAEAAKKSGALTIGVVTKPFDYEGKLKMSRAESGIDKMLTIVDSLIIIPNENLYDMVDMDNYSYEEALSVVDDILRQGVQGISDIITQTGFINVDFADVKTMISLSNGRAHLGIGIGKGDERLQKAITNAFENPLLDVSSIKNARGILANIVCPKDFAMKEYREASKIINNYANENANIKIGVCPKDDIKDEIVVTIVATGFDANSKNDFENTNSDFHTDDIINKSNKDKIINNNSDSSDNEIKNKSDNIVSKLENTYETDNINTIVKEPKKEIESAIIKEEMLNNEEINISDNIKFENNIKNLKKPLISKINRFNNTDDALPENTNAGDMFSSVNSNEDNSIEEKFNRNIVNGNYESLYSQRYETKKSTINKRAAEKIAEDMRFEEEKHNNKIPFDVVSDDYMDKHNKMGSKMSIFGETSTADNDLEKPAFLRRQIQARNTIR
ncbi:cell division protein FtsZ [uncultured Brachyspira sp.]|uniref:cell division protein FtsZ n=1 Tax=uncultured Brachyspira sp. TaxID=221953 RepID=UPI0025E69DC4|nr:cell division protein FtsZ [uncultured Brachyspira sp.]